MRDPNQIIEKDKNGKVRVYTINEEPTKAQQQYKDECDINNIMKKYTQTGEIHHLNLKQGKYMDLSNIQDYQGMLHTVMEANALFDELPALTRKKFDNDPSKLIEFLQDNKNYDEAVELGLIDKNMRKNDEQIQTNNDKSAKKSKQQPPPPSEE